MYSNSYPMDTVYPARSSAFRFEPEDTSLPIPFEPGVPSYQIPTTSSEIEYISPSFIRIGVFEAVL